MEISVPTSKVNTQYIYFADKKKNVVVDGNFIKIIYSTESFEMNGLYIFAEFEPIQSDHLHSPSKPPSYENHSIPPLILRSGIVHNWKDIGDDWIQIVGKPPTHSPSKPPSYENHSIPTLILRSGIVQKHVLHFNPSLKSNNIDRLCQIEFDTLNRYIEMNPTHKQPVYILKNQLRSGVIKYYSENKNPGEQSAAKNPVILKIAGLWETDTNVGITMKFILPTVHSHLLKI